jgi:hypothetical protein
MKGIALLFAAGVCVWAAPPLLVVSVDRPGLPPYEGNGRVYRLEGPECLTLRVGEVLGLRRQGESRGLGRLKILAVHPDHAEAHLSEAGETFPLKGDLAIRKEPLHSLPAMATASPRPLPAKDVLQPMHPRPADPWLTPDAEALPPKEAPVIRTEPLPSLPTMAMIPLRSLPETNALRPAILACVFPQAVPPKPSGRGSAHRAPIYFIKEDASLSPGAQVKLKLWVSIWGAGGRWSLECPKGVDTVSSLRLSALRSELQRLGVPVLGLDIRSLCQDPGARYDAIYVKREP